MKCRLCGYEFNGGVVFELSGAPSGAQYYPDEKDFSTDIGVSLKLCACPICNLHQLDNDAVPYYREVIRSGGYTTTMLDLRRKQYSMMLEHFSLEGKRVFECGCGRGEFLEVWNEFPVNSFGVEQNIELVKVATMRGLNVSRGFVGSATDVLADGVFDAFTSFNFLEHQPDPNGMLKGIFNNLSMDGVGLITVPSLEYILKHNAYYELVIDHLIYFSRDTFEAILRINGFEIEKFDDSLEDTHAAFVRKKSGVVNDGLKVAADFLSGNFSSFVNKHKKNGNEIVVWGASHQGFTMLACAGVAEHIDYIVDSAEFKQGKFSPASHIRILSPDVLRAGRPTAIIIIAPNYADEILNIIRSKYGLNCPVAIIRNGLFEVV